MSKKQKQAKRKEFEKKMNDYKSVIKKQESLDLIESDEIKRMEN